MGIMTYYSRIHICYFYDAEDDDILADSYNEALKSIWKPELDLLEKIESEFYRNGYYTEQNEDYSKYFEIEHSRMLWDEYSFAIIKVNYIDIEKDEIDRFQDTFFQILKKLCVFIWKFEDNRFLEIRHNFFEEIYEVELKIREVASFIFFNRYYENTNLLKEIDINPIQQNSSSLLEKFENEFFHLHFSEYKKLLNIRNLSENEKDEILKESNSFSEYKSKILSRGITEDIYRNFIESMKSDLTKIDGIRNSVMHNRAFSQRQLIEYQEARVRLLDKISSFQDTYWKDIHWDDLWLIPWKHYEFIGTHTDFIKWKKYSLSNYNWGDPVFIGESWEENWFKDVETIQYWKI